MNVIVAVLTPEGRVIHEGLLELSPDGYIYIYDGYVGTYLYGPDEWLSFEVTLIKRTEGTS